LRERVRVINNSPQPGLMIQYYKVVKHRQNTRRIRR
jgi:hypothetical protein